MVSSWSFGSKSIWAGVLVVSLVSCFRRLDLDVEKMVCQTEQNCPSSFICVQENGVGRCRQPAAIDGGSTDGQIVADFGLAGDIQLGMIDEKSAVDGPSLDNQSLSPPDIPRDQNSSSVDERQLPTVDGPVAASQDALAALDHVDVRAVGGSDGEVADVRSDLGTESTDGSSDRSRDAAPSEMPRSALCGNAAIEQEEQCDDGNTIAESCAYGQPACSVCNSSCQLVAGVTSSCGDGIFDPSHEQCDDGNAVTEACAYGSTSCTVCNSTCTWIAGATSYCGDGKADAAKEECDDGNAVAESCIYGAMSCAVCGSSCTSVSGATSYCGDGRVDAAHEQCDDGNAVTEACGYGLNSCTVCSASCSSVGGSTSYCGDGVMDSAHEDCEGTGSCTIGGRSGQCSACSCGNLMVLTPPDHTGCDYSSQACGTAGFAGADFYFAWSGSDGAFRGDNTGMQGLIDLGIVPGSLTKVAIPASGYGASAWATMNHVYVAKASNNEPGHYIVFRVTGLDADVGVSILWIYI